MRRRMRKRGTQRLVVSLSATTLDRPVSIPFPSPLPRFPPPIQPLVSLYPPHGKPANWGQKSIWTCSHFSLICRLLARNRTELRRTRTGLVGGGLFPSWAGARERASERRERGVDPFLSPRPFTASTAADVFEAIEISTYPSSATKCEEFSIRVPRPNPPRPLSLLPHPTPIVPIRPCFPANSPTVTSTNFFVFPYAHVGIGRMITRTRGSGVIEPSRIFRQYDSFRETLQIFETRLPSLWSCLKF